MRKIFGYRADPVFMGLEAYIAWDSLVKEEHTKFGAPNEEGPHASEKAWLKLQH
jgi:hypothetical protein